MLRPRARQAKNKARIKNYEERLKYSREVPGEIPKNFLFLRGLGSAVV